MQKVTRRVFNKRIENKKILEAEPFVKTGISEACIGDIVAMCCKTGREAVEFLRQDYRIKI